MPVMIELYYKKSENLRRQEQTRQTAAKHDSQITYRETDLPNSICLTIEFPDWDSAEKAF